MSAADELLAPWRAIAAKADAHFARAASACTSELHCGEGCCDCCAPDLTVMLVEALALGAHLAGLPAATRKRVRRGAETPSPHCALLVDRRCAVYAARPLICRTHGLPVLEMPADAEEPPLIQCCALNFTIEHPDRGPAGFPAAAILDGERITAALVVADGLVRRALGVADPLRVALRDLARDGLDALPATLRRRLPWS